MFKINYKKNGIEVSKEFEHYEDIIEEVVMEGIKDEDFVSMDLDGEEITGGINGLALYALRNVKNIREARKAAEEAINEFDDEDCDCEEECDCDGGCCYRHTLPGEDEVRSAYNDMIDAFDNLMGR